MRVLFPTVNDFCTHMDFSTFLEVLLLRSENHMYAAVQFLQYYHFKDRIKAYQLHRISGEAVLIENGDKIVANLLKELIDDYPYAMRVSMELSSNIKSRLLNIYFKTEDLNEMDFLKILDFDFMDERDVIDIRTQDYINGQRLIEEKLSNFVVERTLADKVKRPIKVPVENIINLVEHFSHRFIIKGNELELVKGDEWEPAIDDFDSIESVELAIADPELPAALNSQYEELAAQYQALNKEFDKIKKQLMDATVELDDNTAASYQTTIGILLEIMKAPKGTEDKPAFPSEASIIGLATEEAIFRQGKTSLENRFRVAKEALANERKKPHNLKRSSNSR